MILPLKSINKIDIVYKSKRLSPPLDYNFNMKCVTMFSDLHWVGEQDGQLAAAGVTAVCVDNNQVARAWFGQDLVGGKVIGTGEFRGALDGQALRKKGGFQVHIDINSITKMST